MKALKYLSVATLLVAGLSSCSGDFLDADDTSVLTADEAGEVAGNNADVFLNGVWSGMVAYNGTNHEDFSYMATMLATDVMSEDIAFGAFHFFGYDYDLDYRDEQYFKGYSHWSLFYTNVAKANEIIGLYPEGPETVGQKGLLGQAYALRGMAYTYLIQIFQDYMEGKVGDPEGVLTPIARDRKGVPIIYTEIDGKTLDEIDAATGRNTVGEVLDQAEKDLVKAVELLEAGYERPAGEIGKDYIDASVANGLLARYYLLTQQWQKASDAADKARAGYVQRDQTTLQDGFMDVLASDVMWGFDHTSETSTVYASFFSHISNVAPGYAGAGYAPKLIDRRLYDWMAANDPNDYRLKLFNGPSGDSSAPTSAAGLPYANRKFGDDGNWTMDYIYMRAAEMVLISAEGYARQGNLAQAAKVLHELLDNRTSGTWDDAGFLAFTQAQAVNFILQQRRIELWGEGFAYFDLKRNNKGINRNYDGTNHLSGHLLTVPAHDVLWTYQIPQREWQNNEHIDGVADQNP